MIGTLSFLRSCWSFQHIIRIWSGPPAPHGPFALTFVKIVLASRTERFMIDTFSFLRSCGSFQHIIRVWSGPPAPHGPSARGVQGWKLGKCAASSDWHRGRRVQRRASGGPGGDLNGIIDKDTTEDYHMNIYGSLSKLICIRTDNWLCRRITVQYSSWMQALTGFVAEGNSAG